MTNIIKARQKTHAHDVLRVGEWTRQLYQSDHTVSLLEGVLIRSRVMSARSRAGSQRARGVVNGETFGHDWRGTFIQECPSRS